MRVIQQCHLTSSPELLAIATAKRKGKPFMIEGLPYTMSDWQQREGEC